MYINVMENSEEFNMAANIVKKLRQKPNNDELLSLYGLYKQAVNGDNKNEEPSMFTLDFNAKYKWIAWNKNKGKTKQRSEEEYITLVNELIKKYKVIKKKK